MIPAKGGFCPPALPILREGHDFGMEIQPDQLENIEEKISRDLLTIFRSEADFFTEHGSFWTNNTTQLLASTKRNRDSLNHHLSGC
jgi:hypothetical protein